MSQPGSYAQPQYSEERLSNGIPVLFQPAEGTAAATYWWNRVGSVDEAALQTGFAHFLEHMLFKDAGAKESGAPSTGQTARAIESLGGEINAYTSFEQTVYHVTCAEQYWEKIVSHFGKMARPEKFLRTDFEREREVILEELARSLDSPDRQLFQKLFHQTFGKHPYGRPVIGYEKILKKATLSQLEAFYRAHYTPDRMGLVLVGPLDNSRKRRLLDLLEKFYGGTVLKPKKGAKTLKLLSRAGKSKKSEKMSVSRVLVDVKSPAIAISCQTPGQIFARTEGDYSFLAQLDLLAGVLGMGELSRLYQKLFYEKSLVTDVGAGLFAQKQAGMLYFQLEFGSLEAIQDGLKAFFEELRRFSDEGPTEEELKRVIVNAEAEKLYATQTVDSRAGRLGFLKFGVEDMNFDHEYLQSLRNTRPQDIKNLVQHYLTPSHLKVVALLPRDAKDYDIEFIPQIAEEILGGGRQKKKTRKENSDASLRDRSANSMKIYDRLAYQKRDSDLRVLHTERPDSPVFSIHASAPGGLRLEVGSSVISPDVSPGRSPECWGASYLMSLSATKGTESKTSNQISAIVEGHAASVDGFSGRNAIGLEMSGLSKDWDRLSELFSEILVHVTYPEQELAHSRRVAEDSIRSVEDHSSQLCFKHFLETLYETHPYGYLTTGSIDTVRGIDSKKLQQLHRNWIRPEKLVLSVSGAISENQISQLAEKIEKGFFDLSVQAIQSRASLREIEPEPALLAPRWFEKRLQREQLHIVRGGLGTTVRHSDRLPLRLLFTLLGGQSGRLFIQLREKKSLAYSVAPIGFEGLEPGYLGIYIGTSPTKKDEALKGIQSVLEGVMKTPPSKKELLRAKEYYLGRRAMDLQSDSALSAYMGLYCLYHDSAPRDEITDIEKIEAKDIQRVCEDYFLKPHQVTCVVG